MARTGGLVTVTNPLANGQKSSELAANPQLSLARGIAPERPLLCRRPNSEIMLRVFGRLPVTDSATRCEGRRPKSLRGGNRGEFAPAVVSVYGDLASM